MKDEPCEGCGNYHPFLRNCPYFLVVEEFYPESAGGWYREEMIRTNQNKKEASWKAQMQKLRILELNHREKKRLGA